MIHILIYIYIYIFQSHNQFIESRVYEDEEIEERVTKNESKYDVISKEESKNAIGNALLAGAKFMQTAFEIVHFDHEDSDDEEDETLEPIYESKNVYHSRKLPHIIGTQAFLVIYFVRYLPTFYFYFDVFHKHK